MRELLPAFEIEGIAGDLLQVKDVLEYKFSTLKPLDSKTDGSAPPVILRFLQQELEKAWLDLKVSSPVIIPHAQPHHGITNHLDMGLEEANFPAHIFPQYSTVYQLPCIAIVPIKPPFQVKLNNMHFTIAQKLPFKYYRIIKLYPIFTIPLLFWSCKSLIRTH